MSEPLGGADGAGVRLVAGSAITALPPVRPRWQTCAIALIVFLGLFCVGVNSAYAQPTHNVPYDWELVPPGLIPGDKFRLMFVTTSKHSGLSKDIANYNTAAQTVAKTGHNSIRGHSGKFRALLSTAAVSVRTNTGTSGSAGPKIFWLNGEKVADNYGDFYDSTWDSRRATDQFGRIIGNLRHNTNYIWSGSWHDGTIVPNKALGDDEIVYTTLDPHPSSFPYANNPFAPGGSQAVLAKTHQLRIMVMSPVYTIQGVGPTNTQSGSLARVDVPHDWALIPAGLGEGDEFRLLFLTSAGIAPTSASIATYNSHVQRHLSNLKGSDRDSTIAANIGKFRALVCTDATDARDNARLSASGGPSIHWMKGAKVADDYGDLLDGSWDSFSYRDEAGYGPKWGGNAGVHIATGCGRDGLRSRFRYTLGNTGIDKRVDGKLRNEGASAFDSATGGVDIMTRHKIYALSPVFKVLPDPSPRVDISRTAVRSSGEDVEYTISINQWPSGGLLNIVVAVDNDAVAEIKPVGGLMANYAESHQIVFDNTNWQAAQTISIRPQGKGTTTITHTLMGTGNYATVTAADVTVTVSDAPTVQFRDAASEIAEGDVTGQVGLTVANSKAGALYNLTITAADGTATKGVDWPADTSTKFGQAGSFAFLRSDMSPTLTVPVTDDSLDEPDETFTLTLSDPTAGVQLGARTTHTVTIEDDDPTDVTLELNTITYGNDPTIRDLSENQDIVYFNVKLGRALAAGEVVDVPLMISGSGVTRADFEQIVAHISGTSLQDGSTLTPVLRITGSASLPDVGALVQIATRNDKVSEGVETVTISLGPDGTGTNGFDASGRQTNVGGGARRKPGGTHSFSVTLKDPATTVSLDAPSTVIEGESLTLTATLNQTQSNPVTIPLTLTLLTAEASDVTGPSQIVIPAGNLSASVTVSTAEDNAEFEDERFTYALGTLPTGILAGSPSSVSIEIEDDDKQPIIVGFGAELDARLTTETDLRDVQKTVFEGETVAFVLRTDNTRLERDLKVSLDVVDYEGHALAPGEAGPREVTIPAVAATASLHEQAVAFFVKTRNDNVVRTGQKAGLQIVCRGPGGIESRAGNKTYFACNDSPYHVAYLENGISRHRADLQITDDDTPGFTGLSFAKGFRAVYESAGRATVRVKVSPRGSSGLASSFKSKLPFKVDEEGTTAKDSTHFENESGTTVRREADYSIHEIKWGPDYTYFDIPITITNDSHEDSGEIIVINLLPGNGYTVGQIDTIKLIIENDELLKVSGFANTTVKENRAWSVTPKATQAKGGVTWALSGADASVFSINASTGALGLSARDFEDPADSNGDNIYEVTVIATDQDQNRVSTSFTVTVIDVSEREPDPDPLTVSGLTDTGVAENMAWSGQAVSTGGTGAVTWSLSGTDASAFTIDANTGEVRLPAQDYESPVDDNVDNTYEVTVTATDGSGATDSISFAITVTNVAETVLTVTGLADATVAENAAWSGRPAATGATGKVKWSLTGADANLFAIDAATGSVSLPARDFEVPADADTDNVYEATVTATDSATPPVTASVSFRVTVTDEAEAAVTPTEPDRPVSQPVLDEATHERLVFSWTPVRGATLYKVFFWESADKAGTITRPAPGTAEPSFTWTGLKPATAYTVRIHFWTKDGYAGGRLASPPLEMTTLAKPVEAQVPLAVSGLADATVAENAEWTATPAATGGTGAATWALSGADAGLFSIDAATGAVTLPAQDFEAPADADTDNVYEATVTATDEGAATASVSFAITVTDVPEAVLVIEGLADATVAENAEWTAEPTATGATGAVTWVLSGADAAAFSIDAATGAVSLPAQDHEAPADVNKDNVYEATVTATDGSGVTASVSFRVTVTDVAADEAARRWWAALGVDERVRALHGSVTDVTALAERRADAAPAYGALADAVRAEVDAIAAAFAGAEPPATAEAWWQGLDCAHRRIAVGDGNAADAASPWCGDWPGTDGAQTVLDDAGRTEALRIARALFGEDLEAETVKPPVAACPGANVCVHDATAREAPGATLDFTVELGEPQAREVAFLFGTRGVTAWAGADFERLSGIWFVKAGETRTVISVPVMDDAHDEGTETMELYIARVLTPGIGVADGVGTGAIENTDAMPKAWIARFGRTVAEQVLDGVAGRIAAPRNPGVEAVLGGQALPSIAFGPEGVAANPGAGSGAGGSGFDPYRSTLGGGAEWRGMTGRELLLGSSFALTAAADASGGTLAFWGRAAQRSFDGREDHAGGTLTLDGEVTTGLLGLDYARGRWLYGLALSHADASGGHSGSDRGKVESRLTAATLYGSHRTSERLRLWGAAGHGRGELTLTPERDGAMETDIDWTMAALGARGELLQAAGSGPLLALVSDALWARTASEKVTGLEDAEADVTRLRLGLEGSWAITLGGGSVEPRLTLGGRHDGGDAETGFGVEIGGGVAWSAPALGLTVDVEGRTLLAHEADGLKDRGYSASVAFDPRPGTDRGPSLSLRQDWGGQASGGLDTLFAADPLEDRAGSEATSRWTLEAAWGFAALGDRFTASPHAGLGLAQGSRDYTIGWRLAPAAAAAPNLSLGLEATRRETDGAETGHHVGVEMSFSW